jgi:hypothetical protein
MSFPLKLFISVSCPEKQANMGGFLQGFFSKANNVLAVITHLVVYPSLDPDTINRKAWIRIFNVSKPPRVHVVPRNWKPSN